MDNIKRKIIESLKDQKTIFDDFLYEDLEKAPESNSKKTTDVELIDDGGFRNLEMNLSDDKHSLAKDLDELYEIIHTCQKCPLGETRNKFVFGVGNPNADIMLIGEAPGADEDRLGEPFVGRAGKLLNDILAAIDLKREEVYIANIVKCRPPGNRNPLPLEMETCMPYLYKQIDLIKPKLILCLGLVAASALLSKKVSLGKLRGNVYDLNNIKVMATYHPAALLRNPKWKRGCWEDVQEFRKLFESL